MDILTVVSDSNFDSNVLNVKGTFAVEGMSVTDEALTNMKRLFNSELSCSAIVEELKAKYVQKD